MSQFLSIPLPTRPWAYVPASKKLYVALGKSRLGGIQTVIAGHQSIIKSKASLRDFLIEGKYDPRAFRALSPRAIQTIKASGGSHEHPNMSNSCRDNQTLTQAQKKRVEIEGPYSESIEVDPFLLGFVLGKGGVGCQKIEKASGAKLRVPTATRVPAVKIGISGPSQKSVQVAKELVKDALKEAVERRVQYSHFISLPLASSPLLQQHVVAFKKAILASSTSAVTTASNRLPAGKFKTGSINAQGEAGMMGDGAIEASESSAERQGLQQPEWDRWLETKTAAAAPGVESKLRSGNREPDPPAHAQDGSTEAARWHSLNQQRSAESTTPHISTGTLLPPAEGIDESIFVSPKTFHLTVQMLKLWNPQRVQLAADVLQAAAPLVHKALEGRPLVIRLGNLKLMKGSPAKAHVLFADVLEPDCDTRLRRACEVMRDALWNAGLVTQCDRMQALKLHATLINTSNRKRSRGLDRVNRRISFDATHILAAYSDIATRWGDTRIVEAHLSQRFVFDSDGYYHCCSRIPLYEPTCI